MKVFIVQHVHQITADAEDVKFIGVYSTEQRANDAVGRLTKQPGFADSAEGFCIDEYEMDKDHWVEGFATLPIENSA